MKDDRPNPHMARALDEARKAGAIGEVPVGAVIISADGDMIAAAGNAMRAQGDPTAHAEMACLKQAVQKLGSQRLTGCDLYVTLEPCAMCAGAISLARIRRLYYGAGDEKSGGVDHGARVFSHKTCHHKPDVYGGIAERESERLLKAFFEKLR